MKAIVASVIFVLIASIALNAQAVSFEWAAIGNPGNAPDDWGFGAVSYNYRISKHEVTNAQYTEFLNAVDPTGANPNLGGGEGFLYVSSMSSDDLGGINLNGGAANGSKYETKPGRDNNPVVFVSFFDAMRFTNWLHNGQSSGDTESGAYTISSGLDEVRSASAKYWIPSEDEWYKAAYYDPSGVYYDYPTGTDIVPYSDNPSSLNTPDATNVANFYKDDFTANGYDDGYAVWGSTNFFDGQNYLTDVGAYSLATSPYGTLDQGGNVWEWNEAVVSTYFRGVRGGAWYEGALPAEIQGSYSGEHDGVGFRVASITIPEPSTTLLALASLLCLAKQTRNSL